MSYRCGIGASLARRFGQLPSEPHIVCDGCGTTRSVYRRRDWYVPAAWFLDGKHAPGWTGGRVDDHRREDRCPKCSAERKAKEGGK